MEFKSFGCNIYKSIYISSLAIKIIDTPEFQRLRLIKQMGLCSFIFPSAVNTRFEHSLGVYHLTGLVLDRIVKKYPDKKFYLIEYNDSLPLSIKLIECIKIAGLCHDIGHGPFSHIFDDVFLKNSNHEIRSCLILEKICSRIPDFSSQDIAFMKSIINPLDQHKGALYQIVSNYLNGIDVDKFDYLLRDSYNLGMSISFNPFRLIKEFIIDDNDNIAYPLHCSSDIYELFQSRYIMHKKVYSHKTIKLIESMFKDIFILIDPIYHISDSVYDLDEFCKLTDQTLFYYAQNNEESNIIYQNIIKRNLYKQITSQNYDLHPLLNYLIDEGYNKNDFEIIKVKIGLTNSSKHPFDSIYFFDKSGSFINKNAISQLINDEFEEIFYNLICKNNLIYNDIMKKFNTYNK